MAESGRTRLHGGAVIPIPQGFAFVRNRNLSQSMLKISEGFAKGRSETSTDTAVGARQQSSAGSVKKLLFSLS